MEVCSISGRRPWSNSRCARDDDRARDGEMMMEMMRDDDDDDETRTDDECECARDGNDRLPMNSCERR